MGHILTEPALEMETALGVVSLLLRKATLVHLNFPPSCMAATRQRLHMVATRPGVAMPFAHCSRGPIQAQKPQLGT